jgi:uncharacterized protein YdiU (UPF0061 family)
LLTSATQIAVREGGSVHPTAVLVRVLTSSLRIGTFEYHFYHRDREALHALLNHTMHCFFGTASGVGEPHGTADRALQMILNVGENIAKMIAWWMAFGFIHGAINTDNVSILGETLDFGSSDFLREYDKDTNVNKDDAAGLFSYGQQPQAGYWCYEKFILAASTAVEPPLQAANRSALVAHVKVELRKCLENYWVAFHSTYEQLMLEKLGLNPQALPAALRREIVASTVELFEKTGVHYHVFFQRYTYRPGMLRDLFLRDAERHLPLYRQWRTKLRSIDTGCLLSTPLRNPVVVPTQAVLNKICDDVDRGDWSSTQDLLAMLSTPLADHPAAISFERLMTLLPSNDGCGCG